MKNLLSISLVALATIVTIETAVRFGRWQAWGVLAAVILISNITYAMAKWKESP